jgi:hypothetical protein
MISGLRDWETAMSVEVGLVILAGAAATASGLRWGSSARLWQDGSRP